MIDKIHCIADNREKKKIIFGKLGSLSGASEIENVMNGNGHSTSVMMILSLCGDQIRFCLLIC